MSEAATANGGGEKQQQQQQEPPPTPFHQVSSSSTEGVAVAGAASSSPDEVDRLAELPKQALPSPPRRLVKQASSVGSLCRALPPYVQRPPIEAVVFGWGVNEDGQLVCAGTSTISFHPCMCLLRPCMQRLLHVPCSPSAAGLQAGQAGACSACVGSLLCCHGMS